MEPHRLAAAAAAAAAALLVLSLAFAPDAEAKAPPVALAESARGGVWVARPNAPLRLVDLSDGRTIAALPAGRRLWDVSARYGTVWAVGLEGRALVRVDEGSRAGPRITGRRRLPVDLAWKVVASDRSGAWVVGTRRGRRTPRGRRFTTVLLRVDPTTLRVTGTFHLGSPEPPVLAVGHGAVWLAMNSSSRRGDRTTLIGIDDRTGRLRLRRRIAGSPVGLSSGRSGVWLLTARGRRASRLTLVDPRRGGVLRSREGPAGASGLADGYDQVWVASGSIARRPARASLRAYDEGSGRLVSGPWPIACGAGRRPSFLVDLLASGVVATLAVSDDGIAHLASLTVRRGVRRCVPLAG